MKTGGSRLAQGGSYRLLTPAEVAEWLKVSEVTVKNKYRSWGLRPQKVGRLLRFRERDVVSYLDSRYG
ncbi:helix-turn-helix domain-containing protein [Streptomyces virginiae]|uniref:helix-turn-helix domain-containing protein n=1 Tax=Streptomyces TaxID=1883 RepID=UPI002DDACBDA|nr:helix-turn-helix domain-containing protein [Streptomyces virginiae]WSC75310.1 helix-turn-helix domain-containing protein [Streptomyces virginiae]